jgi:hypothetical protein
MKNLLIHSCKYEARTGTDRDGNETYATAETLEHVRIVPVLATEKSDVGETKDDKLTLYYAPAISTPAIVPEQLARVTWNGEVFTIRSVQPCYTQGGGTIHHYEVALI